MIMRKVAFALYVDGEKTLKTGVFHQWGVKTVESDKGIVTNTVAIIECEDEKFHKIFTPCAENVVFLTD